MGGDRTPFSLFPFFLSCFFLCALCASVVRSTFDLHLAPDDGGDGYVNAFDVAGNLLGRVASKGPLNSPWGLALAPANFGKFSGDLLVGNFGDGRIHAFAPQQNGRGELQHRGPLHSTDGRPIEIPGRRAWQPDRDRLATRFERFLATG